jgi:hypothetical protein
MMEELACNNPNKKVTWKENLEIDDVPRKLSNRINIFSLEVNFHFSFSFAWSDPSLDTAQTDDDTYVHWVVCKLDFRIMKMYC